MAGKFREPKIAVGPAGDIESIGGHWVIDFARRIRGREALDEAALIRNPQIVVAADGYAMRTAECLQSKLSDGSGSSSGRGDHSYLAKFLGEPEIAIWPGDNFLWRRIRRGDGILRHRTGGRDLADLVGIQRREPHVAIRPAGDVIHSRTVVQQIGRCRLCAISGERANAVAKRSRQPQVSIGPAGHAAKLGEVRQEKFQDIASDGIRWINGRYQCPAKPQLAHPQLAVGTAGDACRRSERWQLNFADRSGRRDAANFIDIVFGEPDVVVRPQRDCRPIAARRNGE